MDKPHRYFPVDIQKMIEDANPGVVLDVSSQLVVSITDAMNAAYDKGWDAYATFTETSVHPRDVARQGDWIKCTNNLSSTLAEDVLLTVGKSYRIESRTDRLATVINDCGGRVSYDFRYFGAMSTPQEAAVPGDYVVCSVGSSAVLLNMSYRILDRKGDIVGVTGTHSRQRVEASIRSFDRFLRPLPPVVQTQKMPEFQPFFMVSGSGPSKHRYTDGAKALTDAKDLSVQHPGEVFFVLGTVRYFKHDPDEGDISKAMLEKLNDDESIPF